MKTKTDPTNRHFIAYYLTLAIYFVASFFPEERLWGINWWAYVDLFLRCVAFLVALVLPFIINGMIVRWGKSEKHLSTTNWFGMALVFSIVSTAAFYLFRVRTHFLGDGYLILASLSENSVVRLWNSGVNYIQVNLFQLLGGSGEATALLTFQLISYGVGAAFLIATSIAAYFFYSDIRDRLAFLLIAATGGCSLLFFGYVENYPLFLLVVLLFSLVGMAIARGDCNKWFILLPLFAGSLIHIFVVAFIPATLYLLLRESTIAAKWTDSKLWFRISLIGVVVLSGIALLLFAMERSYFLRFALVPFIENSFTVEGYWLFSFKHLLDIANLLLLLTPGLPVILTLIFSSSQRTAIKGRASRFLIIFTVSSLAIIFFLDPKLGMPRDWDLFSFAGIPLSLLIAVMLLDSERNCAARLKIVGLVVALNLLVLAPRVATQMNSATAIELFDNYAQLDKTKNRVGSVLVIEYLKKHGRSSEVDRHRETYNSRYPQEGWIIPAQGLLNQGQTRRAVSEFKRMVKYDPSFYVAWANLGVAYVMLENYDSALTCLKIADGLNPSNVNTTTNIGSVYWEMGNQELAEQYWTDAIELNSDTLVSRILLLRLYRSQSRKAEYFSTLEEIANHKKAPIDVIQLYSDYLLKQGSFDAAAAILRDALAKGLDTTYIRTRQKEFPQLRMLDP